LAWSHLPPSSSKALTTTSRATQSRRRLGLGPGQPRLPPAGGALFWRLLKHRDPKRHSTQFISRCPASRLDSPGQPQGSDSPRLQVVHRLRVRLQLPCRCQLLFRVSFRRLERIVDRSAASPGRRRMPPSASDTVSDSVSPPVGANCDRGSVRRGRRAGGPGRSESATLASRDVTVTLSPSPRSSSSLQVECQWHWRPVSRAQHATECQWPRQPSD
jgi:hypothetical protein